MSERLFKLRRALHLNNKYLFGNLSFIHIMSVVSSASASRPSVFIVDFIPYVNNKFSTSAIFLSLRNI